MTTFQMVIGICGLTLTTANIAWLSYQVRELWWRVIEHEKRIDIAAAHRVSLMSNVDNLDKRLARLESDGK